MTVALSPTPVLTTERLVLRAPTAADWPAFHAFMATERSRFVRPGDLDESKIWRAFGHVIGHWVLRGFGMFVITERGQDAALGATGPWFPAAWPEPEIGWSLWSQAAEGRGIALEAAQAARDWARDALGLKTPVSYIDPANAASAALARRLGCTLDEGAATPFGEPVQVWRHPAGGSA